MHVTPIAIPFLALMYFGGLLMLAFALREAQVAKSLRAGIPSALGGVAVHVMLIWALTQV